MTNRSDQKLPAPTADLRAREDVVGEFISNEITKAGGKLDFSTFMDLALYAPGIGYYVNDTPKLGAGGDFVTAPELGNVFARALAVQIAQFLEKLPNGVIIEFGAGSGILAVQLLTQLEKLDRLPAEYLILELSGNLKARQQDAIRQLPGHLANRVRWLSGLPENSLNAVIVANEVLDAMPVTRFKVTDSGCRIYQVGLGEKGFKWQLDEEGDAKLDDLRNRYQLAVGYQSEVNQRATAWLTSLSELLQAGALLLIDYGYSGREYYHPERREGTLRCHYQQYAHNDPLILTGIQDITAHVDFSALAETSDSVGLKVAGYTTLSGFILSSGILEQLQLQSLDVAQQLALSNEIKRLTLPTEMGEVFKVMALSRNIDVQLDCFRLQDARGRL